MAKVEQIYKIADAVCKQAYGETAVEVVDTGSFVAHGHKVLSSERNTELYTNALIDVIGRTIFSDRRVPDKEDGIVKKPFEYGIIMRKIYTEVPDAQENPSWKIGQTGFKPEFAPIMKPEFREYFFDEVSTYEFGVTIPDYMLKTAVFNESEYGALISSVFVAMENKANTTKRQLARVTRADAIAHVIDKANSVTLVPLDTLYNEDRGENKKALELLHTTDFFRFGNELIGEYVDRLADDQTRLFNQAGYLRYTPIDKQVLTVHTKYAKGSQFYLESDTYHNTLVEMPMYNEVAYFQGSGQKYDFADTSGINVTIRVYDEATNGYQTKTIKQSGIVAVLHDYEAIGVTIDQVRTPTERNNHAEYTNYYHKADKGHFVDMSENIVVFYLADPTLQINEETVPMVTTFKSIKPITSTKGANTKKK